MRKPKRAANSPRSARPKLRASAVNSRRDGGPPGAFSKLVPRRANAWQLLALISLTVGAYLIVIIGRPPLGIEIGEPAPHDFVARIPFQCVDIERTRILRELARQQAPLVFNATREDFRRSKDALLSIIREGEASPDWDPLNAETQQRLRPLLPLLRRRIEPTEAALERLGGLPVASQSEWDRNAAEGTKTILTYEGPDVPERTILPQQLVLLSPDNSGFREAFKEPLDDAPSSEKTTALSVLADLLQPTIAIDIVRTHQRAEAAAQSQHPIIKQILQGAPLLLEGREVREQDVVTLDAEREQYWRSSIGRQVRYQRLSGLAVVLLTVVVLGGAYSARYRPELIHNKLQSLSFALLTLALVGIARLFVVFGVPVLAVPVPLVTMVLCLVFDQRFGFETAALYGLLVAIAQGTADLSFAVLVLGAMMTAMMTARVRSRSTLIKAGLFAGGVQWVAAWGLRLLTMTAGLGTREQFWESMFSVDALCALGNGIMSGFLVSGLLPAIERLFGVTTDIRLLEWSDPNQPLLQRLLLEAPGTYHHSMIVGSLAAEAAEAVGANPLLARVSAYFHDIGKLKKPEYFGENLRANQDNPHEHLSPSMSSLIITAHPRDGAELAERYGLPEEVRDIILESHGSTVTRFFWDKAKKRGAEAVESQENIFRYRAPKPASKEAACVMLCDAVESAARALGSPSPAKATSLVHEIVMDRFHDGQLSESGLSITDLDRIEKSLVHGLSAAFHNRIRYPGQEAEQPA